MEEFDVEIKLSSLEDKNNASEEISSTLEKVREGLRGSIHHMNLGDLRVEMNTSSSKLEIKHDIDYKNKDNDFKKTDSIISSFLDKNINESMSDYEKIYKAYEYTIEKLNYGTVGNTNMERNMVEGLNGKPVVCEAYAFVFHQLMQHMNFESEIVLGDADGVPHAWNIVEINGKWLHVDPTWGDSKDGSVDYSYLLITESAMQEKGDRVIQPGSPKSTRKLSEEDKLAKDSFVENKEHNEEASIEELTSENSSLPSLPVVFGLILLFFILMISFSIF